VSTVDFALLGLWWVTVQGRSDLREHGSRAERMAYAVSLQFVVPGTASLLAQVDPGVTAVWRVSFAIAGVAGIIAILLLAPALVATGGLVVARFLRFGAVPLYALMTVLAVIPTPPFLSGGSHGLSSLQVEAILFCLVVFLGAQVAWAAAMATDESASTGSESAGLPGQPVPPLPGGPAYQPAPAVWTSGADSEGPYNPPGGFGNRLSS
jgi:hypothetical protein